MPTPDAPEDNSYFHADKHVSTEKDDEFGRYPYAAKLARLIAQHYSSNGLVIGIYGQWGEGKSSFMDFVQDATNILATAEPLLYKTIIVKFNPWRFSDEDQLLMSFFAELRAALDTAVDVDTTELATELLKYTQILLSRKSVFGEIIDEQSAKFMALGSLEAVKRDINRAIKSTGRKLLVLIDDSDRLSNEEVTTTLRLVKLTADFTNTTYLLGLNQEMVADAIGIHYSGGDRKAGMEFLEKIIQVPLYLPPIQKTQMGRYVRHRLDEVLYRTGQQQSEQDTIRFKDALEYSIVPALPNPRSVYRLANILLVAIPLLEGEANVTDLILIEALRILYPAIYELVQAHESILTGSFDLDAPQSDTEPDYRKELGKEKEAFQNIFGDLIIGNTALNLLTNLFPKVDQIHSGGHFDWFPRRKRTEKELDRTKSIASSYYFNRYFYYTVLEGEIPEQTFTVFLQMMRTGDLSEACKQARLMIKTASDEVFFTRLEDRVTRNRQAESDAQLVLEDDEKITPEEAERYCDLLICLSADLTYKVVGERAVRLLSRSSGLLLSYLKLLPKESVLPVTKRVITDSDAFELPLELVLDIRRIRRWKDQNKDEFAEIAHLFTEDRYIEITRTLITRLKEIAAAQGKPWYEIFRHTSQVLLDIWHVAYGKEALMEPLNTSFDANPENLATFFEYVYPVANTGSNTVGIRLDLDHYTYLQEVVDVDSLYTRSKDLIKGEQPIPLNQDIFKLPTAHERVHQFVYFYENYDDEIESEMSRRGFH